MFGRKYTVSHTPVAPAIRIFAGLLGALWMGLAAACSATEPTPTPGIALQIFAPTDAPTQPATPTQLPTPAPAQTNSSSTVSNTTAISPTNTTQPTLTVTNDFVNVRKGPAVTFDAVGRLEKGATAKVLGRSGDALWWQIEFQNVKAWVINDYVTVNEAGVNAPVVAIALPTDKPVVKVAAAPVQIIEFKPITPTAVLSATATPQPVAAAPADDGCNPSNPDWRGTGQPDYLFCVRKDLEWRNGDTKSQNIELYWDVYGVQSLELRIEGDGKGGRRVPVPFAGTFGINKSEYSGCFKAELYMTRKDGKVVGYNEKTFCA